MKALFTALIALLTTISALGQAFEGRILYANSCKSKLPNVTDQQWNDMMGTTQEYYIKGGSYKSIDDGKLMQWQLFSNQENKLYTKMANSEAALWNDATVNADEVLKAEVKRGVTDILGYKCDELTLTCKSGVQKYYFSSKLSVDPKLYEQHKFGNWYEVLKNTNAIPLKFIVDTPQFAMESVATEVKKVKLENGLFSLPAGVTTTKSPY
ncbi:hypothetical protein [Hymenobacter elongatus]|uniref:DUF4412 domain-containing protein n=1 Tax=Hymenobacter elongatus TaxID=877208 RepID=A0A4Z0PG60_9BACT|nr:hypothetical protein [Hymenobacter elongatus]TGE14111.1 hypothetical protein E5J99_17370 [Hymenobacter elongatus]